MLSNYSYYPPRNRVRTQACVLAAYDLTPRVRRLTFGGSALRSLVEVDGIEAAAPWVKVFVPGREGRAYTIRNIDCGTGRLEIDFVLHGTGGDDGSVSAWARFAQPGEVVSMAGPRDGGFSLQPDAHWVWLAGDASALPAVQSILERLPSGMSAHVHIEVENEAERQQLRTPAFLYETWHYSTPPSDNQSQHLASMLSNLRYPDGPGQVWIAGEASAVKAIRLHWLQNRGLDRRCLSAKGYWKTGEKDHRDEIIKQ